MLHAYRRVWMWLLEKRSGRLPVVANALQLFVAAEVNLIHRLAQAERPGQLRLRPKCHFVHRYHREAIFSSARSVEKDIQPTYLPHLSYIFSFIV